VSYSKTMEAAEIINKFKEFFEKDYEAKLKDRVRKGNHFIGVDFSDLLNFDHELSDYLLDNPEDAVVAAEEAVKDCVDEEIKKFNIRFLNLPKNQTVLVRNIRSKHIGKLLVIEGVVRQKSDVRPQVTSAKFECPSCGNIINVLQLDKTFKEPNKCGCGRKGKFRLLKKELVDAQGLVLEEDPENLQGGEQPKRMNVLLKDDLVSPLSERKTNPGSKIKIIGTIKEVPIFSRRGSKTTRFDLLIEANNFETIEENFYEVEITKEEDKEIKKLSKDPKVYKKLIESIAPSIYGYEKVKEALILQLMGGVHKQRQDGVVTRGDMHILLIGDPGSGKSQLLKRINLIAPKGRYVSGKGVSGAGLTASVVKDEFLKGWSLEAGALVLANNGMCCLHPDTSIVINNRIQKISKIFDNNKKELGKCKNDIVEFNEIKKDVVSFDIKNMNCKKKISTVIRRKKFDGNLLNIKFKSGFSIKLTPDHKIIDGNNLEWKEVKEFKKGEKILAPLKLPSTEKEVFIFDILPKNWKVFLNKKEKKELKQSIRKKFKTLNKFNEKFDLDKNFLSGGKQITIKKFENVLEYLREKNKWKKIPLKFGRNKNGERLKTAKITPELGYILGFVLGDGHINMNKRRTTINISQSIKNKAHIKRIKKCWNKVSLRNLKESEDNRNSVIKNKKVVSKCKMFYAGSNLLGILYKHYTFNALAEILSLPNDVLKGFIAGVMDSDGCISTRECTKNGKKYFTQIIEFLFSNKREENLNFMLALRKFDCYGKINEKKNIKSVTISNRKDISNLIKELGSFSIKISKSNLLIKNKQISGDSDKIPSVIGKDICNRITKLNKSILLKKGIWSTVYGFKHGKREPSRNQIIKIINKTQDMINDKKFIDKSLRMIKRDYFLDEIVEIKKEEYSGHVYDLFVPGDHNFLADGIIVHNCIDEMDKMSQEDRSAMHEALEQQTISISKANIQATLLARTTVLAAANPKFGRFDPYDILAKQIDLPPALINRFDLIFPIKDLPDKEKDKKMANHILDLHQNPEVDEPEIETELLRKYFAYARQNINPKLTSGALEEIQNYYVEMRNKEMGEEGSQRAIPISPRQLEALIRLAEASAKTRLSKKVTKKDAKKAIDLLHYCLSEIGVDPETGEIDIDRITTGITASQRNKIVVIKEIINELENKIGKTIPLDDLIKEAEEKGIKDIDDAIEKLKRSGDIFEPKRGFIQKI